MQEKPLICIPDKIKLVIYVEDTNEIKKSLLKNIQDTLVSIVKISLETKIKKEDDKDTSRDEIKTIKISDMISNKFNPEMDELKQKLFIELLENLFIL